MSVHAPRPRHHLAEGPRVALRYFTLDDGDEFVARVRESRDLHRPWLFPPDTAAAYAAYARARIESPDCEPLLVCERGEDGAIAGFININNIVRGGFLSGTLGYGAFRHAAGRGLMGEGLALVLRHAFGPLGLHRLEANMFRLEGFSPSFVLVDGAWRDHERWAITADNPIADRP
ncbi:GNAT family N-acetyltransferase [Streptomyces lavendulocolor]|uniref:GNAT family N-acetyltransferase n=1 Tax=Streptomyces lavendulocolor TaxID=67316 RepID=UPI003C2BFDE5